MMPVSMSTEVANEVVLSRAYETARKRIKRIARENERFFGAVRTEIVFQNGKITGVRVSEEESLDRGSLIDAPNEPGSI